MTLFLIILAFSVGWVVGVLTITALFEKYYRMEPK